MNAFRFWAYAVASFAFAFAGAMKEVMTPQDWVQALCFAVGSAVTTALAKIDNAGSGPGSPMRPIVMILALGFAVAIVGCSLASVRVRACYRDAASGARVCVTRDAAGYAIEGEFGKSVIPPR